MRMSTKGRFAVNALIDLGLRQAGGPVALASISARQHVSLSYLEQLFSRLRRQGIVQSTRGPGGGYTLGRPAAEISVAEIVSVVEDPAEQSADQAPEDGPSQALWQQLNAVLLRHMAGITLQSLIDSQPDQALPTPPKPPQSQAPKPPPPNKALRQRTPNSVFAFGQSFVPLFER